MTARKKAPAVVEPVREMDSPFMEVLLLCSVLPTV